MENWRRFLGNHKLFCDVPTHEIMPNNVLNNLKEKFCSPQARRMRLLDAALLYLVSIASFISAIISWKILKIHDEATIRFFAEGSRFALFVAKNWGLFIVQGVGYAIIAYYVVKQTGIPRLFNVALVFVAGVGLFFSILSMLEMANQLKQFLPK